MVPSKLPSLTIANLETASLKKIGKLCTTLDTFSPTKPLCLTSLRTLCILTTSTLLTYRMPTLPELPQFSQLLRHLCWCSIYAAQYWFWLLCAIIKPPNLLFPAKGKFFCINPPEIIPPCTGRVFEYKIVLFLAKGRFLPYNFILSCSRHLTWPMGDLIEERDAIWHWCTWHCSV